NRIMSERSGMGRTGETYLIGPDCLMRSDSFLDPVGHSVVASFAGMVEKNGSDTEASRQALAGKSGTEIITDYRGNLALSAYAPVKVGDITWALLTEMDKSEAFAPITTLTWVVAITVGVTIVAVILISMLISRLLSRKLNSEMSQLQTASSQLKSASQQQLISATEQNAVTGQVSATMNELAVTAKQVSERCLQVSHQAANATICCKDGGQAVQQAQMVMKEIKGHIGKIVQHMLDLGQKSQQINLAVEIITELSEQTTILSYNAAIEAASADDANQGFAVVAEQVGKLAERAKEATRDVRSLIEEIQKATNTAVMATEDSIKAAEHGLEAQDEANKKMNQIAEEIQATLDSVREIEMSSKQQTTATEQVKEGVSNIVSAVKETEASSKQTQATADQLVTTAETLRNI
ncbi:MAG: methyl-accepting chemotaxis protein, partial [candidate division Zixibacteria bacterium]